MQAIISLLIIIVILIGVAIGRYPGLRMNRATIALTGAVALMSLNTISLEAGYAALDLNTLSLLFAMMVLNINLRLAGFFRIVAGRVVRWAHSPRQLLALLIAISGLMSAIFLNDTIVLMFTPLVLEITATLKRNPIPYLMGLATAANIGSVATIVGNPQNMLIGISSAIPFGQFTLWQAPVAVVGLVIAWAVIVWVYRPEFTPSPLTAQLAPSNRTYTPLLRKSMIAVGLMLLAFLVGLPIPLAALTAAALLLITRRLKPQRVFQEIDWSLLVFFASLFIVTGAVESSGWSGRLFEWVAPIAQQGVAPFAGVAVILSNLVSNVPAVLLFRPLIPAFTDPQQNWLVLAMATTLAGNMTLLGSVANLIVAETAKSRGVHLSFREYLKAGIPITFLSLAWGIIWFTLFYK